jgi:16S rRNA (cytosine967-C5)-methyltransferase
VLDESVSWAKRYIRIGAGGMVNAILRKVASVRGEQTDAPWDHHLDSIPLSEGGSLFLNGVELPEHGRRRLGVACSLPAALLTRWETMQDDPTAWAMHTLVKPPTTIWTGHAKQVPESELLEAHESPDHRMFNGNRQQLIALLESHPDIWVQDPASSATLNRLELDTPPAQIIDLCAGQGTKTRQLRAMFPESEIIACEIDPKRLGVLRALFENDDRVRVVHVEKVGTQFSEWADLVLADVPCSNTGVLARRVEARYRPIDAQLKRLVQTQQAIIKTATDLLRPGGTLLYATCSVEVEENESNAHWASEELGLDLLEASRVEVAAQPGDSPSIYRDASFAAQLRIS